MKKPWSGRFRGTLKPEIERFTTSFPLDHELLPYDIQGSIAHVRMLGRQGIIARRDARGIERGLKHVHRAVMAREVDLPEELEDVHMAVEALLVKFVGDAGKKLHTGRSRNDQVALDLRLYARAKLLSVLDENLALQRELVRLARRHADAVMPGYTHLQRAQPVTLGHHLLAHAFRLQRDASRLVRALGEANRSPLGAGALAGSSLRLDATCVADLLGMGPFHNSLDAVSDRDFLVEAVHACALQGVHLSGLAEEIVLWSTQEFSFLELDDRVATGSSLMPQKKNPDVAELARARAATLAGELTAVLGILKGLPLAYNRDLQEAKAPFARALDSAGMTLAALRCALSTARFDTDAMAKAARGGFLEATDIAERLVTEGVPFREAHEAVGRLVRHCLDRGVAPDAVERATLARFHPALTPSGVRRLTPENVVARHTSPGGPAPGRLRAQIREASAELRRGEADGRRFRACQRRADRLLSG